MFFLNPWLLLGLGAVAVPIIIHLTGRRRYKTMPWAAMDFLIASHRETARRLKLLQLLLLAVRVGILALLALALARPTLSGESWLAAFGEGRRALGIVIDASFSMAYRRDQRTLFDEAVEFSETLASGLAPGDSLSIILASDHADVLLSNESRPNVIERVLADIEVTPRTSDLYPALREGIRLLAESSRANRALYVLTDGCRNAWREEDPQAWRALADMVGQQPDPPMIYVVLLGRSDAANAAVTNVTITDRILTAQRTASLEVTAERWGVEQNPECTFSLRLDGKEPSSALAPWPNPAGPASTVATFHFHIDTPGDRAGEVRIAEDRLPIDDRRFFVISARTSIPVLCVDGGPGGRPERPEAFFLATALAPGGPKPSPVDLTVIPGRELSSVPLDRYEVIILANVGNISPSMAQKLKDRVAEGAGLIVFPGDRVTPHAYSALFGGDFLPVDLLDPVGTPGDPSTVLTFGRPNLRHPAMTWFGESQLPELERIKVYRSFPLSLRTRGTPPTVVLSFNSGEPAVVESEYGTGRIVLFALPADTSWSNFPTRPLFLPLLHSLVYHLAEEEIVTSLEVGETFSLRLAPGEEVPAVRTADGALLGRMVPGEDGWATFSGTNSPGVYVTAREDGTRAFAVNVDISESDLTILSQSRITEILSGLPVIIRSPVEARAGDNSARTPVEIWPLFLAAALLLILLEILVARTLDRPKLPAAR